MEKSGIVQLVLNVAAAREEAKLGRGLKGAKRERLLGIPKLEDANLAGTKKGAAACTIILTEGDSAKSLALAGIEVVGRDHYGCFPLRGKFLNVREASHAQILANPEVQHLTKILGLQMGKEYTTEAEIAQLRYGSLMIMTDQDHDGSHIKGLLINFIDTFWPSLLRSNLFLKEFVTPIIKVSRNGKPVQSFFTLPEYEAWMAAQPHTRGLTAKYYKGLGTSTAKEAKEYFTAIADHQIDFEYVDADDRAAVELAFSGKMADARKQWLRTYEPATTFVDHSVSRMRYKDFVDKELILFSVADCARSIPSLCDGLKPGQRKILFACFKRKLKAEVKVAQLSGYVAEHSAYHHGEVSLQSTIVGLAQNFVGSNNINLLLPNGQFGTRNQGGKEAASARYIFTALSPVARHLFNEDDDHVLTFLEEEGQSIEPAHYLPILPLCLVNGAQGIGTGWSTSIPPYNPRTIIANLKRMMRGEEPLPMVPWYKGWSGTIEREAGGSSRWTVTGTFSRDDGGDGHETELVITELPVGKWTRDYKTWLEAQLCQKEELVEELREHHAENRVHFALSVPTLEAKFRDDEAVIKKFNLRSTVTMTNLVLFDFDGRIRKYADELEILKEWYGHRLALYEDRRAYLLARLDREHAILANKVKFIQAVIGEELKINRVKRQVLLRSLDAYGLAKWTALQAMMSAWKDLGPGLKTERAVG